MKRIHRQLAQLASTPRTKTIRRLIYFLLCLRNEIVLCRYWKRPKTYKLARYTSHIETLLSAPPDEFRFLFRMTHPEMYDLCFALDKTSSLRLGPSGNQPTQSTR